MKLLAIFTLMFGISTYSLTQNPNFNLELLGTYDYPVSCNDVWGYAAPDGTEYAILGVNDKTTILSLADPANPQEVASIDGATSIWRDIKTWGDYAYVVADQGNDGLLIIDMTNLPDDIEYKFWKPIITTDFGTGGLNRAHNIYIDEDGYLYLAGSNRDINNGGVIVLDIKTDPYNPQVVGHGESVYAHDVYVRDSMIYSSNINDGDFSVMDGRDKSNIVTLARQSTSSIFTHNAWLSDDGNYLYTTDELPYSYIDAYDISDLSDIKRIDQYRPHGTGEAGSTPHNVHVLNDYLVISWYSDGLKIVDASRPNNMIEVASFDTYTGNPSLNGCWGAYPFLPSGLVLASDIQSGLFVFKPTYTRACFLEGKITDESDGVGINNVKIELIGEGETHTDGGGNYTIGTPSSGNYDVLISHPLYESEIIQVSLINGQLEVLDVALKKLPTFNLNGRIVDDATNMPIEGAKLQFNSDTYEFSVATDSEGRFNIDVIAEVYDIYFGAWGYQTKATTVTVSDAGISDIDYELEVGYEDIFEFDFGWEVSGNAKTGIWVREKPIKTTLNGATVNTGSDTDDLGNKCYLTGNGGGNAGTDDVDNGITTLESPIMDLSTYDDPVISFSYWFYNAGGNSSPDDELEVHISDGNTIEKVTEISTSASIWNRMEFKVRDYYTTNTSLQNIVVSYSVSDFTNGHFVEAAIDKFEVGESNTTSTRDIIDNGLQFQVFPNPSSEVFNVNYQIERKLKDASIKVYNILGQEVIERSLEQREGNINLGEKLERGIYFIHIQNNGKISQPLKITKLD